MAPRGVTNHFGRISIPNDPIHNDDDFNKLISLKSLITTSSIIYY